MRKFLDISAVLVCSILGIVILRVFELYGKTGLQIANLSIPVSIIMMFLFLSLMAWLNDSGIE